jgi:hypothetical protein
MACLTRFTLPLRRRNATQGHWLLIWEGDLVNGELIEASVLGAMPWRRREGRLWRAGHECRELAHVVG